MQIADSAVQFSATHQYMAQQTRRESVRAWIGAQRPAEGEPTAAGTSAISYERETTRSLVEADRVDVGAAGLSQPGGGALPPDFTSRLAAWAARVQPLSAQSHGQGGGSAQVPAHAHDISGGRAEMSDFEAEAGLDPKLAMVKDLLERLYGIHIKLTAGPDAKDAQRCNPTEVSPANDAPQSQRQGWGVEVTVEDRQAESETTTFTANGMVKTTDGKEISFTLNLTMQRQYEQQARINLKAGDAAIDPLVINFNGTAAQLSDTTFQFDLQGDGQAETVHTLGQGSGFLALDRNGDGQITDGTELFGPQSGDGFAELAQYDADGNQWIDETDPIYAQLRLWQPGADGNGTLTTLSEKQVGAIYLSHADTPFAVKDTQNDLQAQVVSSGVYLAENGTPGSVQQVDLAV